jgi:hypothetical protein
MQLQVDDPVVFGRTRVRSDNSWKKRVNESPALSCKAPERLANDWVLYVISP